MRTLSTTLATALGGPVQRPAFLLQAGFGTVRRWSSMATVTWGGQTWTAQDMALNDLQVQALQIRGTLTLGNADGVLGQLVLDEGVQDRSFALWGYDAGTVSGGAVPSDSVVPLAVMAVGATAEVGPMEVRISLRHPAEFQFSPRTYVNEAAGFRTLLPAGAVLRINGIDFKLDRRT